MNSIHRTGLTIAGLATAAIVSGVFVVQGYVAAQQSPAHVAAAATTNPTPQDTLRPETIYVNPIPSPQVIHVTQTQPPTTKKAPVIHVIVPSTGGGDDNGGSDD